MANLPYHCARLEGRSLRSLYRAALPLIARGKLNVPCQVPLDVFSYSGENSLPEQVASVRSFLTYVGQPKTFAILSDGSYSPKSIDVLEGIDASVHVARSLPNLPSPLPDRVQSYLKSHPTGKQLALIMSIPRNGPALYVDSDVLFFPGARDVIELSQKASVAAFYLADYQFSGDERLLRDPSEKRGPANTGFALLFQKLDWSLGLERLATLTGEPSFFTNQTVFHLTMHANRAVTFDSRKYVLKVDDQFIYRDRYASGSLAIRHYVNPVRHKFWTAFARRLSG